MTEIPKIDHVEDCQRIVAACLKQGYVITLVDAYQIWRAYSRDQDAQWLLLDSVRSEEGDYLSAEALDVELAEIAVRYW